MESASYPNVNDSIYRIRGRARNLRLPIGRIRALSPSGVDILVSADPWFVFETYVDWEAAQRAGWWLSVEKALRSAAMTRREKKAKALRKIAILSEELSELQKILDNVQ